MNSYNENIYSGQIERFPASAASTALVSAIDAILVQYFGGHPRQAHKKFTNTQFLARLSEARKELSSPFFFSLTLDLLKEYGVSAEGNLVDQLRLRAITPFAHRLEAAAPAYFIHRDTWYSNPQAQINWWLPLYDTSNDDGFKIYPNYFQVPVKNDSKNFDYSLFKEAVGWQRAGTAVDAYPRLLEDISLEDFTTVAGPRASLTRFSGSHLHGTQPIDGLETRFSVDFRTVAISDHKLGIGAPNIDNASIGSTLEDFLSLGSE